MPCDTLYNVRVRGQTDAVWHYTMSVVRIMPCDTLYNVRGQTDAVWHSIQCPWSDWCRVTLYTMSVVRLMPCDTLYNVRGQTDAVWHSIQCPWSDWCRVTLYTMSVVRLMPCDTLYNVRGQTDAVWHSIQCPWSDWCRVTLYTMSVVRLMPCDIRDLVSGQVMMYCYLIAPSHYFNQCYLITDKIMRSTHKVTYICHRNRLGTMINSLRNVYYHLLRELLYLCCRLSNTLTLVAHARCQDAAAPQVARAVSATLTSCSDVICPSDIVPVCASNGHTYANECAFNKDNCR